MTVQHKDISDAERHEPKGISTATDGLVYAANGDALSGTWELPRIEGQSTALLGMIPRASGGGVVSWQYAPEGWAHYRGAAGQVFTATPSKVLIDGSSVFSRSDYLPYEIRGTGELFDVATSTITPISEGDTYDLRLDIRVTAESGNPTEVRLTLDLGGAATITVPVVTTFNTAGRTVPCETTIAFPIFCLDRFLSDGGQLFLSTDVGTLTTGENGLTLVRNTSGGF